MHLRLLLLMLAPLGFLAGQTREEIIAERVKNHAQHPERYVAASDDPALPRVLLIGDSITAGYFLGVRENLRGTANVHLIPDNGGPTWRGLLMLDDWLCDSRWNLIHFNFGLHDIKREVADQLQTAPEDYRKNLRALVDRLRATGARLVFATSTPVPASVKSGPPRRSADMPAYNAAAREVMAAAKIPVNDLYAFALAQLAEIQLPHNVHFTPEGYRALAAPVAAAIRAQLPSR